MRRVRIFVGSIVLAAGILIEALERVDFVWSHVPETYAKKVADPKVAIILILVGFVILLLSRLESPGETSANITPPGKAKAETPKPNLLLVYCKTSYLQAIERGAVLLSFRNDVMTSRDDANGVIAHISYLGPQGARIEVSYGKWVEGEDYLIIGRGDTKNLIIAMNEGKELFAVEDIGPQTNYQQRQIVEVGRLIPGDWMVHVTVTAEYFKKEYRCKLFVSEDGSVKYSFPK